jgi:phosphatidylserine/phosphatidylglycerophosphate/cardiolipin synthase-like enzyme
MRAWVIRPASTIQGEAGSSKSVKPTASTGQEGASAYLAHSIEQKALQLIARASRGDQVRLEMYELANQSMVSTLVAAARRGAGVEVMLDRFEGLSRQSASALEQAGVQVRWGRADPGGIDHVKALWLTGRHYLKEGYLLLGGMNWGQASFANDDADVLLPAAPGLPFFQAHWAGTQDPSGPVLTLGAVLRGLGYLVAHAHGYLDVKANYLSSWAAQDLLATAARRGVRVRVLLTPGTPEAASAYRWLLAHGVEVRWASPTLGYLHAKWAATQGLVLVGSANWSYHALGDARSMPANHAADVLVAANGIATTFVQAFQP